MDERDKTTTEQQGQQPIGQEGRTGSDQGAFGKRGGTTFTQGQTSQLDKQDKQVPGETPSEGFVGTSKEKDTSEAYLTEDEAARTDFAEQGQGAAETTADTAANEDIESGTTATRDATLDDGS